MIDSIANKRQLKNLTVIDPVSKVAHIFSRPRKPTDNCFVESFNRVFREECLNENYFESLSEAKRIIESWRIDFNENRPQKELKGLTPNQFKTKLKSTKNSL